MILKPCPFCGRNTVALIINHKSGLYSVLCDYCNAESGQRAHELNALSAWNDRFDEDNK